MGQLDGAVESWILSLSEESKLREKLRVAEHRLTTEDKYRSSIMRKLGEISNLYKRQIDDIKSSSRTNIQYDERISNPLGASGQKDGLWALLSTGMDSRAGGSEVNYDLVSDMWKYASRDWSHVRSVEVPVQDARTKALIHKLAK